MSGDRDKANEGKWRFTIRGLLLCFVIVGLAAGWLVDRRTDGYGRWRQFHAQRWDYYLRESVEGSPFQEMADKLNGKYLFSGYIPLGGTGHVEHVFVIDDVTEVTVVVDRFDKIIAPPRVTRRHRWLRYPDGTMVSLE
jgi:hypothetical protein